MKKLFLFLGILLFVSTVYAKGSIDISKESITIEAGKTEEVEVLADNLAGLINIESTDANVVVADQTNYFFDTGLKDDKLVLKLTGRKAGKAQINIILSDVSTYDEETLDGTKTIDVTVTGDSVVEDEESSSNTTYIIIGVVACLLLAIITILLSKRKKNLSSYWFIQ